MFGKYVAAAVTKGDAMRTSPELAAELNRYISSTLNAGKAVMMGPVLSTIGRFCSYRREAATGHSHMAFLMLRPASMKARDVAAFVQALEERLDNIPK